MTGLSWCFKLNFYVKASTDRDIFNQSHTINVQCFSIYSCQTCALWNVLCSNVFKTPLFLHLRWSTYRKIFTEAFTDEGCIHRNLSLLNFRNTKWHRVKDPLHLLLLSSQLQVFVEINCWLNFVLALIYTVFNL